MTLLLRAFAPASLFLSAVAAPGQPPAPPHRPPPAWQVDWGNQFCSLIRLPDREAGYGLAVRALPGSDYSDLFLVDRGHVRSPPHIDKVALGPSGASFDVAPEDERARVEGAHRYGRLPPEFWDALAGAAELRLEHGERLLARIPLRNAAAAVVALRRCMSDAMREWGMDEAAWRALSRRPKSLNALGVSDLDYPRDALRRNLQGRVVVRVDVGADGRVTACHPVATSGIPRMDEAACHAALTRGRFAPALNAAGEPVASQFVTTVTFLIGP